MSNAKLDELLDEVELPSARGGRKRAMPVEIEVVRSLTSEDLPLLLDPPPVPAEQRYGTLQIRHAHHLLARCLANGTDQNDAALITGYSVSYISDIKNSPAFAELLAYYQTKKELVFVDVAERMKVLGLNSLDELQRRLEAEPDEWSKRELMELSKLMLIDGRASPGSSQGGGGPGVGLNINVKFVTAGQGPSLPGPLVDVTPVAVEGD